MQAIFYFLRHLTISTGKKYNSKMKKILLVEDDPAIVSSLTLFMKNEGYLLDAANGQHAALEKIAATGYDLVLLDISLHDGNGFSTCSAIKSQTHIPVIFLTANDDEYSVVSGLELGADDYICKPFRPRELLARINNVLRRTNTGTQLLTCRDLSVDVRRAQVHKNGTELFLSALEYRLLLVFLQNPGTVFSRQLLHDQLSLLSRMEWLIDVLLKLSRLDAGTITFEKKNFNVQELITQAAEPFSVSLELKQLTLNTDGVTSAVLCGDKKWLAEALSNVIKNCMEHTPAGGQLTIRVKETALYTQLTVTDTGSGIPTEELSHIFERFYHGKIANKNGKGNHHAAKRQYYRRKRTRRRCTV